MSWPAGLAWPLEHWVVVPTFDSEADELSAVQGRAIGG
jgi:hypothetical protein